MEVKVQHNQNQAISSQAEPATSRECEHMWAQHHSHFQNTHTRKGSGNILRFSQFISAVHISMCQSMSSPWPRTLQLRIMTQVQTPHSQGSEKFEAYPIHLCQHLIFWSLWSRRRDIIMTSSWHHHDIITFWDFAPSAYEWCAFLDSSKGPQPNETWQDCPHHGSESSTQSKPSNLFTSPTSNQQRMWAYVSSASFALSKHSHPQRVRKHSEVFSIHLGRPHINLPKHVITVTKNVAAQNHDTGSDASFPGVGEVWGLPNSSLPASHFLITLEQKTWHHHDIIMTSSHFGTLHHQPMSGVHSWTHQKGLSRTRPDKIVLIMEVKVQHNQNQAISSQAQPATSRECEHMWAQHHSHFQNTHTHKGSGNILRFSQFISAVHISICQSMSSPWPRTLQLRIMTQVQTPHSQGSEKFEAYPIHLCQHLIFWSLWSRRRDIIMTSSWHHHILGLCTISLWVVCILGLIKRASAERDLTRLSSSWKWKFNTIKTKQSLHKPNQQPAENVSICELSIIRTFKTLTPTKGQETFWGFLNSSRPSTYQSAKACHHRDQERCSSESWHRFRRLIPRGRRSLRLTQFIFASISFFDHFGAEDVTSSWHHHDIITFWDFAPSAYEWCAFLDSSKGPQPNETWQDCPHHGSESSTQSKPSNLFTSPTSNQQRMWAYVSSASFALSKHSHPQRVRKHSEVFSIHLGRPHINLPKHVITVTKNVAAQNHDTGSDASFPGVGEVWGLPNSSLPASHFLITLEQKTWHHHDIIMTSSWHHHDIITFWDFAPSAYEWCAFLDSSKGPQPNETWQDCPHHGSESSTQSKPSNLFTSRTSNQQRMWAYVSSASFALSKHSHPQRVRKHSEVFSIHLGRPHINLPKHVITVTKNVAAQNHDTGSDASFPGVGEVWGLPNSSLPASHFLITLEQHHHDIIMTSSWHHHDIITFWDFAPSAYEWCAFLDSSKGPQPNETWQDCPHHGSESSTQSKPSNLFTSPTSNQQRMWAYVSSASFALSKHSHPQRVRKHSEVFSIHLGRPHINLPKHVITVTKNVAAQNHDTGSNASFPGVGEVWGLPNSSLPASHFLITLEQKTWHHHDIIMTSSHFGTLHHQPMSGVHSWTHQKGLSRTRPDKIVLIMEVKVQHNQNQAISSLAEPATSRECEHMWAQHHSHFQNTHTHKGSGNILRFSQFISAVHISICQSMSSPWPRTLQLRIMTQVQTPHSQGSEKFEAYPIHLCQHLIFDHFGAEDVTSSWHHHDIITFWDFAPSAYEWCAFLDSSKGPQPNETWQDCPHHGSESSTQSKPSNLFTSPTSNQQRMWAYVSSASFALSKHSHPHTLTWSLPQCRWDHMCLQIAPKYIYQVGLSWHWYQTNLQVIWVVWVRLQPSFGATFVPICRTAWRPNGAPPESISSQVGPSGNLAQSWRWQIRFFLRSLMFPTSNVFGLGRQKILTDKPQLTCGYLSTL